MRNAVKRQVLLVTTIVAALASGAGGSALAAADQWLTSWACPAMDPLATGVVYPAATTVRDTLWATLGGDQVRVKFSNAFV